MRTTFVSSQAEGQQSIKHSPVKVKSLSSKPRLLCLNRTKLETLSNDVEQKEEQVSVGPISFETFPQRDLAISQSGCRGL